MVYAINLQKGIGDAAGAAVDFALYPLDTMETRLHTGSRWTREVARDIRLRDWQPGRARAGGRHFLQQLLAAAAANAAATGLRAPAEILKTRAQKAARPQRRRLCRASPSLARAPSAAQRAPAARCR